MWYCRDSVAVSADGRNAALQCRDREFFCRQYRRASCSSEAVSADAGRASGEIVELFLKTVEVYR
jgi:hypothetical protein